MQKQNMFDKQVHEKMMTRLDGLAADSRPLWGKMNSSQMMAHLSVVLESALGKQQVPDNSNFLSKTLVKKFVLSGIPFFRGAPTAPEFAISNEKDFHREKTRLQENLELVFQRNMKGPWADHTLFGKLTGEEWGWLHYKHTDHHFRQFGL